MITSQVNCNLKPGDFPVCRITAPIVLKGVKLDKPTVTHTPTVTSNQATPMSASSTILPTSTDPAPASSSLTQSLSNLAITPTSVPQTTSPIALPSVDFTFPAQSQARSLPASHYLPPYSSPSLSPLNSPVVKKTYSHAILSQCHSPKPFTGATRKR